MTRSDFQLHKIYLIDCADGIARQRCGRHVEHSGPLRALRTLRTHGADRYSCIVCKGDPLNAPPENNPADEPGYSEPDNSDEQ